MKIFKFGGASVKDANAVRNVLSIIQKFVSESKLLIVISAMGKTTNLLEEIYKTVITKNEISFKENLQLFEIYHQEIINDLFENEADSTTLDLKKILDELTQRFEKYQSANKNFEYDQIVSLGEVISTRIVNDFLQHQKVNSAFIDARTLIRTNNTYKDANVNWEETELLITNKIHSLPEVDVFITQGFIGHTPEGFTTTLGREGSDYSAAIFAYCLDAENVTIWKDVPGMLNADPKYFSNTVKLDKISYKEALELSYYGASVIHPKTIKPLQNKDIQLFVKSFLNSNAEGSVIQKSQDYDNLVPSFIIKKNQILFSVLPKDFSFIVEENLGEIFSILAHLQIKLNLMQNSALSFSFAVDEEKVNVQEILKAFQNKYEIRFNDKLELLTIRHYNTEIIKKLTEDKELILEQKTRQIVRILFKSES